MLFGLRLTDETTGRVPTAYGVGRRWEAQEDDVTYCERRIAEEEAQAATAGSPEAGLVHSQVAMLYRAQLATLLRCPRG